MRSSILRKYLVLLASANVIAMVFIWFWFPEARSYYHQNAHVKLAAISCGITGLILGLSIFSLLTKRWYALALGMIATLQIIRLFSTMEAIGVWPGGDDGTRMAWEAFVNTSMWILAILGVLICLVGLYKNLNPSPKL